MKLFRKCDRVLIVVGSYTFTHKKAGVKWICGRAYATADGGCGELLPGGQVSGAPCYWKEWKPADERMLSFYDGERELTMSEGHRLKGCVDDMLDNAQTIRIQQLEAASEAMWPEHLTEKADAAWRGLNAAHKAAAEMLTGTVNQTAWAEYYASK